MVRPNIDSTVILYPDFEHRQNNTFCEIPLIQKDSKKSYTVYSIGSNKNCDIVLPHRTVSGHHADLIVNKGKTKIKVKDRRSANGVYDHLGDRFSENSYYFEPGRTSFTIQISIFTLILGKDGEHLYVKYGENSDQYRIEANQLYYNIGKKQILKNIDIVIHPGEFVGLFGPSGSGKTTLLKLLSGNKRPTKGNVYIGGLPLKDHFDLLRERVGYVPQDDIIYREFTVEESLLYSAKLRLPAGTELEDLKKVVDETLAHLDIVGIRHQRVSSLSGGQRKRVSIGVEMLTSPRILMMDEPDAGLDPHIQDQLMDEFRKQADSGAAVIMTTHTLDNFHRFDYVAIISMGHLVFYGAPSDALAFFKKEEETYKARDIFRELDTRKEGNPTHRESIAERHAANYKNTICYKRIITDRSTKTTDDKSPKSISEKITDTLRNLPRSIIDFEYKKFWNLIDRHIHLRLGNWRTLLLYLMVPIVVLFILSMQQTVSTDEIASMKSDQEHYAESIERQKSGKNENKGEKENKPLNTDSSQIVDMQPVVPELDIESSRMLLKPKIPHIFPLTLVLTAIFCGIFISSSEISQEWSIYKRERLVCTSILPYILSKIPLLFGITFIQMSILFSFTVVIKDIHGIPFLMGLTTLTLVAWSSVCLGLLLSSIDKSGKTAIILSIVFIIPQIIWSGAIAPNFFEKMHKIPKAISNVLVSRWGFEGLALVFNDNAIIKWGSKVVEHQLGFMPHEEVFGNPLFKVHFPMVIICLVLFFFVWISLKTQDLMD
ncbi:MAG: ATP-binding cassette domain-containing protein [bacterium]